ncbi:MAG: cellobiose transport system permease protein [Actinomycetota bacterium]|nr:cellobiose transport system permease protein [Actinomycetota bacterium]
MSTVATPSPPKTDVGGQAAPSRRRRWGGSPSEQPAGVLTYIALVVTILLSAFPLYWMFIVGSSTDEELGKVPPSVVPSDHLIDNFRDVFAQENAYFISSMWNSLVVSVIVTVSVLFFCSLAGFAFAKLKFRGRDALMVLLIATMTIPNQLGQVALYIIMGKLNWIQQLPSVIVPGLVTAFGVFYMRQFIIEAIPDELVEAARVDGASTFRIYWSIVMPTLRPAAGVLGLLTFASTWNDFQWPFIVLFGSENITVQVSLSTLASGQIIIFSRMMAGAVLATIPLLVVFFLAGKQIVAGIMEGAVKS